MGLSGTFCVLDAQITLFSGSPQQLQLFCPRCAMFDEFNVRSGSIFGHAAVPEYWPSRPLRQAILGLSRVLAPPAPSTILFPSAETRLKPDLNGIDGVMTSRPGFNPFFGTSAAAPHVAAVAAIVMQSKGVGATAQSVAAILKATATDLGPPGFDFNFGAGLVDALTAINPLISINNVVAKKGQNAVFTVTLLPASNQTITVDYSTQDGTAIAGADYIPQSNTLSPLNK
jgi:subtilisin family serine protease